MAKKRDVEREVRMYMRRRGWRWGGIHDMWLADILGCTRPQARDACIALEAKGVLESLDDGWGWVPLSERRKRTLLPRPSGKRGAR